MKQIRDLLGMWWQGLSWRWSQFLLRLPGYKACRYCQRAFRSEELGSEGYCPGCAENLVEIKREEEEEQAWQEEEARQKAETEKEIAAYFADRDRLKAEQAAHEAAAWDELRNSRLCPSCGHRDDEHSPTSGECTHSGCLCGHSDYDLEYEEDELEPREVNLGDSPGGFRIYE